MGLWGAIQAMKESYEQNRALLKFKGSLKNNLENRGLLKSSKKRLKFKEVGEEELEFVKNRIRKDAKVTILKQNIILFIVIIAIIILIYGIMLGLHLRL